MHALYMYWLLFVDINAYILSENSIAQGQSKNYEVLLTTKMQNVMT